MTTRTILDNYEKLGYVFFTFTGITTEINAKGEEKKKPMGMPNWRTITKDNFKENCLQNQHGLCIICGSMSNITVVDYDLPESYDRMVAEYPDLKKHKTIKTRNGYHIYFQYDETIKTTTNAMINFDKIDIRNDNSVIFAPPTVYKLKSGEKIMYEDMGGELLPVPDIIRRNLKQNQTVETTPTPAPAIPKKKFKVIVKKPESGSNPEPDNAEIEKNNDLNDLEKFRLVSQCYSLDRLSNYDTYINLTMAVKNTFGELGKGVWEEICRRGGNFDQNKNNEQWFKYSPKKKEEKLLKFGSLMQWAKEDNPDLYDKLFGIKTNWDLHEAEFAKALKRVCFKDKPVLFTGKGNKPEGYLYNGVYWVELSLHNAELQKDNFDNLYKYYLDKLEAEKKEMRDDMYGRIMSQLGELNRCSIRKNIIMIFKADNYVENVEWNKNKNLFVFEDKVYDLSIGKFVESNPDDYINMTCGYSYDIKREFVEDEIRKDIIKIFKSIIKENEFDYFMKVISSFLIQNNIEEKAYFWLGKGRNGKGTITTLLRRFLGKYWGELNTEYYTTYRHRADEPNQNLYNCKNSRVLNTSEVAKDDKSNAKVKFINDAFNRITGNDMMYARELGTKNVASFKAGKVLIQLNDMPEFSKDINKNDVSLRERIVIIEFPYSFVNDADLINKEPHIYKPIDTKIKAKFETDEYRKVMVDMMFEYYAKYLTEGLSMPESVKSYTNSYFGTQNIMNWFNANYEPSDNDDKLDLSTVKFDYNNEFGGNISVANLRKKLTEAGLDTTTRCVNGYTTKPERQECKVSVPDDTLTETNI